MDGCVVLANNVITFIGITPRRLLQRLQSKEI
jgi:hypothetical protein